MGLPKGKTNNPAGKPPGAINKLSRNVKMNIAEFLETRWPDIEKEFDNLKGWNKVKLYLELLPYNQPKMQSIEMVDEIDRLNEDEVDRLYNKIIQLYNENKKTSDQGSASR